MYHNNGWWEEREKRGILKCSVVFNASNKEKKPSKSFCSTKPKLGKGNFNNIAWLTRNQLEKLQNCTKLRKISKLFQIRSPFISYSEEEPLKKLEHQVDSHDHIEILSVENNRLTNGQLINGCLKRQLRLITK